MQNIALFGTSADPPTEGHKAILRWLSQHFDWVAVWASNNPFKSHGTTLEQRMTMLHLLVLEIATPHHNISLEESLSSSRTIETVYQARQKWGQQVKFTFVMGADLLGQFPNWYRVQELVQKTQFLIIPRPHYEITPETLNKLDQLGAKYKIADFQPPPVSSTAYRQQTDPHAVSPTVQQYIQQEQLYP
ncbi:MAG: nicotinate-nucleotide adenylyltransferase [Jaaginema sp. PMC 1079.18]|nr:nicotinate-nucleotide adenylyltransferase [Jaaginema sp. PMC 1080.18]MEC4850082.1 nicotinate-nucleotide adenylyltransferase [Jaaginema sp. PMC 1079.18]MEC4867563.1 nicotinate-nucleotide adenylyltransferase [Jaaginema sp. PMC 1078.18]